MVGWSVGRWSVDLIKSPINIGSCRVREKFILLSEHSNQVNIFHVRYIENLMGFENLEEFLKISSS